MELRHFRYFVAVAEEMHFGRAAVRLGISQPPLSQQIRLMEEEIGTPLLERTSRRVSLTEAGRHFLIEARRTLDQAAHAVAVARRVAEGAAGEVAVGFTSSVPFATVVARALSAFRAAYPAVRLNLVEMPRGAQIEALATERLDVGVIRGIEPPVLPATMRATLLTTEPLLVAMRSDHPLALAPRDPTMADLRCESFVLYQRDLGAGFNEHLARLCTRAGFVANVVQEVTGPSTLLGLVAAGMGITILTPSLGALHPENMVSRPLDDPEALSRLWLIRRNGISEAAGHFVALIQAASRDEPAASDPR
ncbi:LysR substrate-binding domain-containing protein [Sphingomonas profundi]|uniref:LysR substrate-binding domain-containing protein n=1 Tax=Alterirhizorhabdus profundi TaxID=2681549 RepID=UPI0012E94E86|nr:LysR substrate-binding domain-containing protein [Sphingomonas profundi]